MTRFDYPSIDSGLQLGVTLVRRQCHAEPDEADIAFDKLGVTSEHVMSILRQAQDDITKCDKVVVRLSWLGCQTELIGLSD